jgi:4-amino-4-deoxy-L-arabinose transferase-like glycosyltransferase
MRDHRARLGRGSTVVLLAIVALAAALRLPHLASNPGWDGDEGYNYNIALNLAHGHHQMFALDFVFVQHPPLFFALAAGLFRLLGPSMLALRLLSVAFCLGTLALLPALGRMLVARPTATCTTEAQGHSDMNEKPLRASMTLGWTSDSGMRVGLLAALAYAVLPLVAVQNRFGYTYNGLAFWTALALLALLRYRCDGRRGSLILCGLAGAAALCTDQEGVYLLPVLLLGLGGASLVRRLGVVLLALCGPALYLGVLALTDRAALVFDVAHTAGRVTGGSLLFQMQMWLYNLADLMRVDLAIPIGLAGLALIPDRSTRRLVLGLLAAMLLIILKIRDPNPLFRTAEPLLPLVCLGLGLVGAMVWAGLDRMAGHIQRGREGGHWAKTVAALLIVLAAVAAAGDDVRAATTRIQTPIKGLLPRSTADAYAMAGWLNARLHPDDVVLAMPQVSWLFHARTAELLQAVAITGRASAFYPAGIPRWRWVYDVHLAAARYLVVDTFTRIWISQNSAERALVRRAERTWRRVYAHGEYQVYENPARAA